MSILDRISNTSKKGGSRSKKSSKRKGSSKGFVEKKIVRKKKGDKELDELIDFSDIEGMMNGDGVSPEGGPTSSDPSGLETRLTALEEKIIQMDGSIKSTRTSLSGVNDRLEEMEKNILKLLSVYEVVKRDINPFIGGRAGSGPGAGESTDPAYLSIEGAELIRAPDITDDLDGLDLGSDILLPEDANEKVAKARVQEENDGLSLFEMPDLDESPVPVSERNVPHEDEMDHVPPERPHEMVEQGGSNMDQEGQRSHFAPLEELVNRGPTVSHNGKVILETISHDYRTVILVLRWIEFMFERVTRDKISSLLDYYKDIGWISPKVKSHIMAYARGEVQNIFKYEPPENEDVLLDETKYPTAYKKVNDWRLSADDHLKSLLFITKIAGIEVNKDTFNSLEEDIKVFTRTLEGYHGV